MWPKSMQFITLLWHLLLKILAENNENWRNFKTNVFQKKTKQKLRFLFNTNLKMCILISELS